MPRQKKRGSGVHLDLGAIFGAIGQAGVKPNPTYDPNFTGVGPEGPLPKPVGVDQPYKASNIFARPEVNRLNTQYLSQRGLSQAGVQDQLGFLERSLPLKERETRSLGGITNQLAVEKEQALTPVLNQRERAALEMQKAQQIAIAKQKHELDMIKAMQDGRIAVSRDSGIMPFEENFAKHNNILTEPILAKQLAETETATAKSILDQVKLGHDASVFEQTKDLNLGTAVNQAQFNNQMTAGQVKQVPGMLNAQMAEIQAKPGLVQDQLMNNRLMPLSAPIWDRKTGNIVATPPPKEATGEFAEIAKSLGIGKTPAPSPVNQKLESMPTSPNDAGMRVIEVTDDQGQKYKIRVPIQ